MLVLGVETATECLGLALRRDDRLLGELELDLGRKHCEKILIGLDGLLSDLGVRVADLSGIAVSQGPGSFTGLRIGLAFAQGLALAKGVRLVGIPTLDCLAHGAGLWEGPLIACLDARRGEVYFCAYMRGASSVKRLGDVGVGPAAQAAELAKSLGPRVLIVGTGADQVGGLLGREALVAPLDFWRPRAAVVARLGVETLARGGGEAPDSIEPIYVRRSDAEIRRQVLAGRT